MLLSYCLSSPVQYPPETRNNRQLTTHARGISVAAPKFLHHLATHTRDVAVATPVFLHQLATH